MLKISMDFYFPFLSVSIGHQCGRANGITISLVKYGMKINSFFPISLLFVHRSVEMAFRCYTARAQSSIEMIFHNGK